MISLSAVGSAGQAASYYARDNYYSDEQQKDESAWMGRGAAALGLKGSVETKSFEAVLGGKLPNGEVVKAPRGDLRPGLDLTLSVSKSVSLAALVGGDKRLIAALRQSTAATLAWVEKNVIEARVSQPGKGQVPVRTGNLAAATFLHDVNRKGEPQLHVHAVIVNATQDPDGKWRALHNDELYKRQHVIGAVFNADFRARVEALGYETVPAPNPTDGSFEIAGIERGAVEAFSTRSTEIRAQLQALGRAGSARERELAALATRAAKEPATEPETRLEGWRRLAGELGLDTKRLVETAIARAERGVTVWDRAARGLRGAGEKGLALAARMGLTPRDGDPLVPERLGRLEPRAYAAAQAVASAARDLGEREAAFERLDLVRVALERGGPVTVADVEARIAVLEDKGLLIGDGDRMVTPESAVRLERAHLAAVEAGRGASAPIVPAKEAAARAQEAARALELQRLNPGQERAAALILSSPDRVVNVQGAAGRGKSAMLAPAAAIARSDGRSVIGLAVAGRTARQLGKDTGVDAVTLASFLGRHARVIDGTARPAQRTGAMAALKGAVIIVDEASQVGTRDMERLTRLANMTGVARLVMVGDTRQLGAIDAGKPFERSQAAGHVTAHLTENLRAKSDQMVAVNAALDQGDIGAAFEVLKPATIETAPGEQAPTAARMWAALPKEERETTLLLASGRAMRTAANAAAQTELKRAGEISGPGTRFDVLDRVTVTREGARQMRAYEPGRVVEFRTELTSQGIARGGRGVVLGVDGEVVRLRMSSGETGSFRPDKLPRNLAQDAVSIHAVKSVELHAGDRIRWTDNDRDRGLLNGDLARVEAVDKDRLRIASLADGSVHKLKAGDRMSERLDLAYAVNVHVAQGVTARNGIIVMSSRERMLNTTRSFLVAVTRVAEKATLVLDDPARLERAVTRNPGDKSSALEVANARRTEPPRVDPIAADRLARYLRAFSAAETAIAMGSFPTSRDHQEERDMSRALDHLRPRGAEDARIILDRDPGLLLDIAAGRSTKPYLAWLEEGRARAEGGPANAERFVKDWRSASAELSRAETAPAKRQAEFKIERLGERARDEPALRSAVNEQVSRQDRDRIARYFPEKSLSLTL